VHLGLQALKLPLLLRGEVGCWMLLLIAPEKRQEISTLARQGQHFLAG